MIFPATLLSNCHSDRRYQHMNTYKHDAGVYAGYPGWRQQFPGGMSPSLDYGDERDGQQASASFDMIEPAGYDPRHSGGYNDPVGMGFDPTHPYHGRTVANVLAEEVWGVHC